MQSNKVDQLKILTKKYSILLATNSRVLQKKKKSYQ